MSRNPLRIDVAGFGLDVDIQRVLLVNPPDDHPGTDDFRMAFNLPRQKPLDRVEGGVGCTGFDQWALTPCHQSLRFRSKGGPR